jgi:hypothetical protein
MEKQGSFCRVMPAFLSIPVFTGMKPSINTEKKVWGAFFSIMHHLEVAISQNFVLFYDSYCIFSELHLCYVDANSAMLLHFVLMMTLL